MWFSTHFRITANILFFALLGQRIRASDAGNDSKLSGINLMSFNCGFFDFLGQIWATSQTLVPQTMVPVGLVQEQRFLAGFHGTRHVKHFPRLRCAFFFWLEPSVVANLVPNDVSC